MPNPTKNEVVTMGGVKIRLNSRITCKYPKNGVKNILKKRKGVVEYIGEGASGPYITLNMGDEGKRNLSLSRIIDPEIN